MDASLQFTCLLLLVNSLFWRQWIFLLHFCLLQRLFTEFLNLSPAGFVRHGCRGSRARHGVSNLYSAQWPLLSVSSKVFIYFFLAPIFWKNYGALLLQFWVWNILSVTLTWPSWFLTFPYASSGPQLRLWDGEFSAFALESHSIVATADKDCQTSQRPWICFQFLSLLILICRTLAGDSRRPAKVLYSLCKLTVLFCLM